MPAQRGYPDEWQKRKVRPNGRIKWKGRNLSITRALVGQYIGLQEIADGQWAIHFESLQLGQYDERRHRLQPARRLTPSTPTQHA